MDLRNYKPIKHQHNYVFVQRSSEFNLVNPGTNKLFEKNEFAILLCKACNKVVRTPIEDKDDE